RAARPSHGRGGRQHASADLLQQDRSRAAGHRWSIQDGRRHRTGASRPADPGLARRQCHTSGRARLKLGGSVMGKVVVVTSGKGGVGKTTSTDALGAAMERNDKKVVLIAFDVELRI